MFKSINLKTFAVLLLTLTMSACASLGSNSSALSGDHYANAGFRTTTYNPLPVAVAQVELKTPETKFTDITVKERTIPLSLSLSDRARVVMSDAEIECMAQVIYFEARGEGTTGMIGVGYTVLNRMGSPKFKSTTACGIVYEKNRRGCQFSWTCDGKPDRIRSPQLYERARDIAVSVMTREAKNPVGDSIFFRHRNVNSRYASSQRLVATIGQHRFFIARQ